jgi:ubiquinone biosynthesis protein UbiJ
MVKLGDLANVDLNFSHLIAAGVGALVHHYYITTYKPRRLEEKRQDALEFARTIAPYIAEEVKSKVPQAEAYATTDELVQVLKEVKDVLKEYGEKK